MSSETPGTRPPEREVVVGDSRANTRVVIGAIVLVAVLLFVFQNTDQVVQLEWAFFNFEMVLWAYTVLMVVLGMLLGVGLFVRRSRKKAAAAKKK